MENQNKNSNKLPDLSGNNLIVPLAILVAGAMIAGAVIYSNKNIKQQPASAGSIAVNQQNIEKSGEELDKVTPVGKDDHLRGNPEAPVKIVEFSDTECPFCKRFHYTMQQVMDEYGKSGKVAWVYRHFPLDSLHGKARKEAEALECANELGGNSKFWAYMDKLMEITPSNDGLDLKELPKIAQSVSLDKQKFELCLNSGKFANRVSSNLKEAIDIGGRGTPYNVVFTAKGEKLVIPGALPYESVKTIIEKALNG